MPIYEYRCPSCGHTFERLQSFSEPPVSDCPECGGTDVKKLISQTSFALKGGGWYKDHYGLKSGGGSSAGGSSAGGSGSSGSGSSGSGSGGSSPPSGSST
jgi:putative FmdB family regulatory protein